MFWHMIMLVFLPLFHSLAHSGLRGAFGLAILDALPCTTKEAE